MARGQGRRRRLPQVQRVAAYAVILRGEGADLSILLSRLAGSVTEEELWTLPGGGLDHGEDPRDAVVREVYEETGLPVEIGETAWVYSFHQARAWRVGRRVDAHSLRIVYDGWVPVDAPEPHTTEVGGSTMEAAWVRVADVLSGTVPTVSLVHEALEGHAPTRMQRVSAYAVVLRGAGRQRSVLLTRISPRGYHSGSWTLPGGGVDFGESPRAALAREVREETGLACTVGEVLEVDDVAVTGTAPNGRHEEFHGVHLVFAATVGEGEPRVVEADGTTDAVAWVPLADVAAGQVELLPVVRAALAAAERRLSP
ncbi:NUDIX hydrolase [Nocardioides cheoyonin]|uniref:NUDIX hydrolase n=1 Tax=Nocardioides cheoyonin TaxID=3156615 RepID=UPI0032B5EDDC